MTSTDLPEHLARPHLRPVQPIPVRKDGKQFLALRDPSQLLPSTMVVPVQALPVLQRFVGQRSLEEIASEVSASADQLLELARGLDQLGLLWGPTFDRLEAQRLGELRASGAFPARVTASLGDGAAASRAALDKYFADAEDPEIEEDVIAIVAPHLDYARGWPNYAAAYHPMRGSERPDRVVILGTNHFGLGAGVVLTEFGFETPLGRCPADSEAARRLIDRLGPDLVADQLDHLGEHSIELHVPWIQHLWGDVPIVAALIPNPLAPPSDEEPAVSGPAFVEALRETIGGLGGRTICIASSDLSHVGPQFGEPRPVDEQRRIDVEQHDRDMMGKFLTGDPDEFLAAMRWCRNATGWCSVGNMAALLQLAQPDAVELIDYRQAYDERGLALVSSAAIALV
jgi:hypothetical protein